MHKCNSEISDLTLTKGEQKRQKEFQEEPKKCKILFRALHLVAARLDSLEKNVNLYARQ